MSTDASVFLDAAAEIAFNLCRDALWDQDRCNWFGAAMETVSKRMILVHRTFGPDIYSGTSGIALFLGETSLRCDEPLFRKVAWGALRQAVSSSDGLSQSFGRGFFTGLAGIAYAQIRLGMIFNENQWIDHGLRNLRSLPSDTLDPAHRDVAMGAAGMIPILLAAGTRFSADDLIEKARMLGNSLIGTATREVAGWSWTTFGVAEGSQNLTGFSHGAAGVAWSLLELSHYFRELQFQEAAMEGFRYERHWFDASRKNWPDFRSGRAQNREELANIVCSTAWCHGAPGIGLSRLRAFEITGDPSFKEELLVALATTAPTVHNYLLGRDSFCLCHGVGGNSELSLECARAFKDSSYRSAVDIASRRALDLVPSIENPWIPGIPGAAETPGFMLGLSGIGYFFLRLHDDSKTPSLLIPYPDGLFRNDS
jgi:lantibiotic modifying enzyme